MSLVTGGVLRAGEPSEVALSEPPPPPPEIPPRYHSLDFLRGALMLLGIVFHTAVAYDSLSGPELKAWPTSDALSFIVVGSHGFRMPLFFVLAGFFAALLYARRGAGEFAINRIIRIGVPLLVGWVVLVPLVISGLAFTLGAQFINREFAWEFTWLLMKEGEYFFTDSSAHLWFLYYLLFFYGACVVTAPLLRYMPAWVKRRSQAGGRALLTAWWRVPALAIPTAGLLYIRPMADTDVPLSFTPDPAYLALFGWFFVLGAFLYGLRDTLGGFQGKAWVYLLVGLVMVIVYKFLAEQLLDGGGNDGWRLLVAAHNAFMIWLLFFGLAGVLLRYLDRPIPAVRYVADASYWFYLVHLPLVAWLPGILAGLAWAPELKFLLVLALVTMVCFVTYELFVRWTYLGTVLQGRRYPAIFSLRRRGAGTTGDGSLGGAGERAKETFGR